MCGISHQATHLLFKYYVSKLRGGVKSCADYADAGWGVPNQGKLADIILEHSLIGRFKQLYMKTPFDSSILTTGPPRGGGKKIIFLQFRNIRKLYYTWRIFRQRAASIRDVVCLSVCVWSANFLVDDIPVGTSFAPNVRTYTFSYNVLVS